MSQCEYCEQDMNMSDGCTTTAYMLPGGQRIVARIKYESFAGERCHDCNAQHGQYHHPGCDMEKCPICHGQAYGCDCFCKGL